MAKRICGIKPSATLALTARAKAMKKEGLDVVNLGAGEPDFDTPDEIKREAIEAVTSGFTKYTPSEGTDELRKAVSAKFKAENNLSYSPEQIVVSCGAKHSLYNLIQVLCDPGDEVLIIAPFWVSYPEMARLASAKPVIIKTGPKAGFKPALKDLKNKITKKTKVLIINSPSNPAGIVYNRKELEEIGDIAVSKNIFVISDEIYEKIIFDNEAHVSMASFSKDIFNLVATVNGVSKTYSMTGWRIGYLGAPREIARAVADLQSHSTSNPTSISQKAALKALGMGASFVEGMRRGFEEKRDCISSALKEIKGLSFVKPKGAFYVFCDISKLKIKADEFCARLLEEGRVCAIPGTDFGFDDHIRLSFAAGIEDIQKGVSRIKGFVERL